MASANLLSKSSVAGLYSGYGFGADFYGYGFYCLGYVVLVYGTVSLGFVWEG